MAEREVDTIMLNNIQQQLAEAKGARSEVLNQIGMLSVKYDCDRELQVQKEKTIEKRLSDIEEWRKYATRSLLFILVGIVVTIATSVVSVVLVTQNSGSSAELMKVMIKEIKTMNTP